MDKLTVVLVQYVKQDAIRVGACGLRLYADKENQQAMKTVSCLPPGAPALLHDNQLTPLAGAVR